MKNKKEIQPREIVQELKSSYIDYAMSVIVARALPDVRDGLKPVHRRILYSMLEEGLRHNAKFRKSAAVTGLTLARYHPHGDMAVYNAMVRLAQDFSSRYTLVKGQGNFGCFTGDTKVKLCDGRELSFKNLVKENKKGKKHWGYTFNHQKKEIEITKIKKPRLTRKNEKIIQITLDNDEKIKCTLDHRFLLRKGNYKEAQNLKKGDSLMPLYLKPCVGRVELEGCKMAKTYNHKIVDIKILKKKEDVYDITVDPWHNFALAAGVFVHNSIDSDPPAAPRYTEAKLSAIGEEMLKDIEKDTVDFMDNYDGTNTEPKVLPSPLPQLVLNGSLGIAVGMATSFPPHNLTEVCDALIYLLDNKSANTEDIFQFIQGPDFPTGGIAYGQKEMITTYSQGKGPIVTRGKVDVKENKKGRNQIIITEIPYLVAKSALIEQFAKLVKNKKIQGVKDIRDESDKEGMRIVFDLQKNTRPQRIINKLYKFTNLQKTFHINSLALVDGMYPKTLSLVEILNHFIAHRKEVIKRRTQFELDKAKARAHILEGLKKCLDKIDEVIKIIKSSESREDAKKNLMKKFKLTEIQTNAILETKLSALAKLERKKIEQELADLLKRIKELTAILKSSQKIKKVLEKELKDLKERFGDDRRTKIIKGEVKKIAEADLVPHEEVIITLTTGGYIKRINPSVYKIQKRGGKGILGMKTRKEDIVEHFLLADTHDQLLLFTDSGKVFKTIVYEVPEGTRVSRGRGLMNFIDISSQEKILSLMTAGKKDKEKGVENLVIATKNGIVKKTDIEKFENIRSSGLIAINLKKNDLVRKACKTTGKNDIMLITKKGQSIRFEEKEIRKMGRTASGVKGMNLKKEDNVVGVEVIYPEQKNQYLLIITEKGFGKRTLLKEYKKQGRGGSGIKTANITSKTGDIACSAVLSGEEEDLIVISQKGHIIRTKIGSIAKSGRATQGVKIMKMAEGDKVASIIYV